MGMSLKRIKKFIGRNPKEVTVLSDKTERFQGRYRKITNTEKTITVRIENYNQHKMEWRAFQEKAFTSEVSKNEKLYLVFSMPEINDGETIKVNDRLSLELIDVRYTEDKGQITGYFALARKL